MIAFVAKTYHSDCLNKICVLREERESVWEREREKERERERESVCVCVCERERFKSIKIPVTTAAETHTNKHKHTQTREHEKSEKKNSTNILRAASSPASQTIQRWRFANWRRKRAAFCSSACHPWFWNRENLAYDNHSTTQHIAPSRSFTCSWNTATTLLQTPSIRAALKRTCPSDRWRQTWPRSKEERKKERKKRKEGGK